MNLAIDQGNTYCKMAIFEQDKIIKLVKEKNENLNKLKSVINEYSIERAIVSSVSDYKRIETLLRDLKIPTISLTHSCNLPIKIQYKTPETLGLDRIAAAVGAWKLSPNTINLIIDIGTAVTYDITTPKEGFIGGNIAPGLDMRLKAMHQQTKNLPLLKRKEGDNTFGQNTNEAIRNGAQFGIIAEIKAYIRTGTLKYGKISTFLTGGDASFFDKKIKNGIFAVPNLVLLGLHEILKINQI